VSPFPVWGLARGLVKLNPPTAGQTLTKLKTESFDIHETESVRPFSCLGFGSRRSSESAAASQTQTERRQKVQKVKGKRKKVNGLAVRIDREAIYFALLYFCLSLALLLPFHLPF
jgi:hypothetical protein